MGHMGANRKPPYDALWVTLCQRLSRPIFAAFLTTVLSERKRIHGKMRYIHHSVSTLGFLLVDAG